MRPERFGAMYFSGVRWALCGPDAAFRPDQRSLPTS